MDVTLNRRVFSRQSKGVETHREEDVEATHAHESGTGVGWCHGEPVANMQVTTGIREHCESVVLGFAPINARPVEMVGFPPRLPLRFNALGCVLRFIWHVVSNTLSLFRYLHEQEYTKSKRHKPQPALIAAFVSRI